MSALILLSPKRTDRQTNKRVACKFKVSIEKKNTNADLTVSKGHRNMDKITTDQKRHLTNKEVSTDTVRLHYRQIKITCYVKYPKGSYTYVNQIVLYLKPKIHRVLIYNICLSKVSLRLLLTLGWTRICQFLYLMIVRSSYS